MNKFKSGLLGTLIIFVLLGNMISGITPVPQASEVKMAGHTTSIVAIAIWVGGWFASINWSTSGYNPNYPEYLQN